MMTRTRGDMRHHTFLYGTIYGFTRGHLFRRFFLPLGCIFLAFGSLPISLMAAIVYRFAFFSLPELSLVSGCFLFGVWLSALFLHLFDSALSANVTISIRGAGAFIEFSHREVLPNATARNLRALLCSACRWDNPIRRITLFLESLNTHFALRGVSVLSILVCVKLGQWQRLTSAFAMRVSATFAEFVRFGSRRVRGTIDTHEKFTFLVSSRGLFQQLPGDSIGVTT